MRTQIIQVIHNLILIVVAALLLASTGTSQKGGFLPGARTLMDAHNCYPYYEWWSDRIDRALSAGTPLAIEQDLTWYTDPHTGRSWPVVAHGGSLSGKEPTLEHYFFDRVRPIVEEALRRGNRSDWPLITLNLDFKTEEPQHLAAIWDILKQHQDWLTAATRSADERAVQPLEVRPILVLTGESDAQETAFYRHVPVGDRLLVFGAVHSHSENPMAPPEVLEPEPANNYRRWWNNAWSVVEQGGQTKAGDWTDTANLRLQALVKHAHVQGLWIRFYTLDGTSPGELSCHGWFRSYNFGSFPAARVRWQAAANAGVDFIATDQYEQLARELTNSGR
jgi:hypothetical protein